MNTTDINKIRAALREFDFYLKNKANYNEKSAIRTINKLLDIEEGKNTLKTLAPTQSKAIKTAQKMLANCFGAAAYEKAWVQIIDDEQYQVITDMRMLVLLKESLPTLEIQDNQEYIERASKSVTRLYDRAITPNNKVYTLTTDDIKALRFNAQTYPRTSNQYADPEEDIKDMTRGILWYGKAFFDTQLVARALTVLEANTGTITIDPTAPTCYLIVETERGKAIIAPLNLRKVDPDKLPSELRGYIAPIPEEVKTNAAA